MRFRHSVVIVTTLVLTSLLANLLFMSVAAQNEIPFANAGNDMTVAVGEVVSFHGEGLDSDGRIDLYEWDFDGDGTYDSSNLNSGDATWTYQETRIFNAMLRVTDNDGATDTDVAKITVVTGNDPPTADPGPDLKVHAKSLVEFNGYGNDSDGDIIKYKWDFDGDGTWDYKSDDTGVTTWIYTIPDTYYPVFQVIDDGIVEANDTETIKVVVYEANQPPIVNAGMDIEVHAKQQVRFHGEATDVDGRIMKYEWDFDGDGKTDRDSGTTGEAVWIYDKPDTYIATLKVTDNHELPSSATDSVKIKVLAENKPPKSLAGADLVIKHGEVASFKGQGTDDDGIIVGYKWDFDNDGKYEWSSAENGDTSYFYENPGEYTARLMVRDEVGATANSTLKVTVLEVKKPHVEQPLIEFNLSFILALIIGLAAGLGVGIGATYGYLKTSIASKYKKLKQLEGGGGVDEEPSFRGTQVGEREPPAYRGGDQF